MEINEFAKQVLLSDSIQTKLESIQEEFTDNTPGDPIRIDRPARPQSLLFRSKNRAARMPHPDGFLEPRLRAKAHHIMANHELQALEIMAWTILAFPQAPTEFRLGIAEVMRDEQKHTLLHIRRAKQLGLSFGDYAVNGYFWKKAMHFQNILDYVAAIPLTFEGGNLDHTLEFASRFDRYNDPRSKSIMLTIHRDEIDHVAFGFHWIDRLKPELLSHWETYRKHLQWPMHPGLSKGRQFNRNAREHAGMKKEFIDNLESSPLLLQDAERQEAEEIDRESQDQFNDPFDSDVEYLTNSPDSMELE